MILSLTWRSLAVKDELDLGIKQTTEIYESYLNAVHELFFIWMKEFGYFANMFNNPIKNEKIPKGKLVYPFYMDSMLWGIQDELGIKIPKYDLNLDEDDEDDEKTDDERHYGYIYQKGVKDKFFVCNHWKTLSKIVENRPFNDDEYFNWIFVKPEKARNRTNPHQPSLKDLIIFILNLVKESRSNTEPRDNQKIINTIANRLYLNDKPILAETNEKQSEDYVPIYSKSISNARYSFDDKYIKYLFLHNNAPHLDFNIFDYWMTDSTQVDIS